MAAETEETNPKSVYSFNLTPSCSSAVKWSCDGRMAIATNEAVVITELEYSPNQLVSSSSFHIKSIPAIKEQYNMSALDGVQFRNLQDQAKSAEQKQELALDYTLCPLLKSASPHSGFRAICWSPLGADRLGRCILATLSHDHRLLLHSTADMQWTWSVVCDLSSLYLKNLEENDRIPTDVDALKTKMYRLSAVEMSWTTRSTHSNVSTQSAILSVAMANGDILLWQINFPCQSQEDCTLLKTLNFTSQWASVVAWSGSPVVTVTGVTVDYMGVGYQDGSLHLAAIDLKDGEMVSYLCLHKDHDLLAVDCLNITWISPDRLLVLVAKQTYLLAYVVDVIKGDMAVACESCNQVDTSLYITAICYKHDVLLVSACDGGVFRGEINLANDEISISLIHWSIDGSQGQCYGVDISSNGMLAAVVMSSSKSSVRISRVLMCKKPSNLYIQPLAPESDQLNELQIKVKTLINDPSVPLTRMVDAMEIIRRHLWLGKNLAPSITDQISTPISWYSLTLKILRVLRYFLITIDLHIPRIPDSTEINEEVVLAAKNIEKVKHVIIGRYICDSLERLLCSKRAMTSKDKSACESMVWFMSTQPQIQYKDTPLWSRLEEARNSLSLDAGGDPTCCICGGLTTIGDNCTVSCEDGHTFGLCCQTLQPCTEPQYRSCSACKLQAISYTERQGLPWLAGMWQFCTVCEGFLVPCT